MTNGGTRRRLRSSVYKLLFVALLVGAMWVLTLFFFIHQAFYTWPPDRSVPMPPASTVTIYALMLTFAATVFLWLHKKFWIRTEDVFDDLE